MQHRTKPSWQEAPPTFKLFPGVPPASSMGKRPHTNTIGGLPSLLRPPNTAMPSTRGLSTGTYIKHSFPYLNLVVIHVAASQRNRSMSWDPNTPLPPNRRHQSSTQPTSLPATHKRREDFRHALVRMIMYVSSYMHIIPVRPHIYMGLFYPRLIGSIQTKKVKNLVILLKKMF